MISTSSEVNRPRIRFPPGTKGNYTTAHEARMIDRDAVWNMEVFLAVVDGGTLAAAARALRVTPSAVSKQLVKLERRLGARLLVRTTRSLRVTPAGARYRAHAQAV